MQNAERILFKTQLVVWIYRSIEEGRVVWKPPPLLEAARPAKCHQSYKAVSLYRIRNIWFSKPADVMRNSPISPVDRTWGPMHGQAS